MYPVPRPGMKLSKAATQGDEAAKISPFLGRSNVSEFLCITSYNM